MKVTIRYFARLREAAGREEEQVEVQSGDPSLGALLGLLAGRGGDLEAFLASRPVLCAVNREYAGPERTLEDGDEVALFPPVSGG